LIPEPPIPKVNPMDRDWTLRAFDGRTDEVTDEFRTTSVEAMDFIAAAEAWKRDADGRWRWHKPPDPPDYPGDPTGR
jgi:hypothetical protein